MEAQEIQPIRLNGSREGIYTSREINSGKIPPRLLALRETLVVAESYVVERETRHRSLRGQKESFIEKLRQFVTISRGNIEVVVANGRPGRGRVLPRSLFFRASTDDGAGEENRDHPW